MIGPIFNQMSQDLEFLRLRGQETGIEHCIPPRSAENAKSRENIVCNGFVCLLCLLLNVLELCGGWKVGKGAQTEPIVVDRGARYGSV